MPESNEKTTGQATPALSQSDPEAYSTAVQTGADGEPPWNLFGADLLIGSCDA